MSFPRRRISVRGNGIKLEHPCLAAKIAAELAIQKTRMMKEYITFEALLKPITEELLKEGIKSFDSDYYSKTFKTYDHLIVLLYAQLHDINSLRDLEIAFNSQTRLRDLLHCSKVSRSTLSDASAHRPAGCFLWIAEKLMSLLPQKRRKEVNKVVRKLDSSPIQLKGRGYDDWTLVNKTLRCQGIKLHVEYDSEVVAPTRVQLSRANIDDCSMGRSWPILPDTIYVFDKGYYDFNWWLSISSKGSFFVTRLKKNASIQITQNNPVSGDDVLEDNLFIFRNKVPRGGKRNLYTEKLRQVIVKREGKSPIVLVTNLLDISAETVSELYKERWDIELFFKWVKQNLRIKKFLGKSENAVKTQIVIALILFLLMALFNLYELNKRSMHQLLIWIRHNWEVVKTHYKLLKPPEYQFPKLRFNV